MFKFFAVAVLVVAVEAIEPYGLHGAGHGGYLEQDYYTEPHYSFVYEVNDLHTHDIKSHKEERKGDHTQGVYELIEPDGSKRIVQYSVVGKSGFNAVVHREPSKHPISAGKVGGAAELYNLGLGRSSGGYNAGGYSSAGHGASSYSSLSTKGTLGGYGGALKLVQPIALHSAGYSNLGAGSNLLGGGYKSNQAYLSYGGSQSKGYSGYGNDATSSVNINTHGAHISALTHHIVPQKHHY